MDEFSEGDVVRLKSGGPNMTVESLERINDRVFVIWYDDDSILHRKDFAPSMLKKFQPRRVSLAELRRRAHESHQNAE